MPHDRMQELARKIDRARAEGFAARCAARGEACQCPDAPRVTSHECPVHQVLLMPTAVMVPEDLGFVFVGASGVYGRGVDLVGSTPMAPGGVFIPAMQMGPPHKGLHDEPCDTCGAPAGVPCRKEE